MFPQASPCLTARCKKMWILVLYIRFFQMRFLDQDSLVLYMEESIERQAEMWL
ncbi:hypothetical protein AB205_0093800 [Aquarana catesbeiana]|uniref:Uncharacterized protein n=1 Tax=Aquarana catesbeiana TaxID=8400 RepID=A0A2G9PE18_AQUCT|nr:hypothetical protein AB205_0093800 [Aquarana catesbeiana]